jgi:NAD(P)-dependent dehydrogenase (short-subunit alcohol dehydrogenase family)
VIGAASGLGRDITRELARCGAHLQLWDVQQGSLDTLVAELRAQWPEVDVHGTLVDITDGNAVAVAARAAHQRLQGGLSLVINSAGRMVGRPLATAVLRQQPTAEQLGAVLSANTLGPMLVAREALPLMLGRGEGLLVTVGSVMGLTGAAGLGDYCASKHALVGLHESLRLELWRHNAPDAVRTMLVCPYHIVDTPMFGSSIFGAVDSSLLARYGLATRMALRAAAVVRPVLFPPLHSVELAQTIVLHAASPSAPPVLVVPWLFGVVVQFLRGVLPVAAMDVVLGVSGGWHGMDSSLETCTVPAAAEVQSERAEFR